MLGSPASVFRAIKELTPRDIPLLSPLMALRSLPNRLIGKSGGLAAKQPLMSQLTAAGFADLGQQPDREIVVGCIGQFWKITGNEQMIAFRNVEEFTAFETPGYVKVAMSFLLEPENKGTLVSTETRILATDEVAKKRFSWYWRVIGVGSGAIRRSWLKAIRRRVQQQKDPRDGDSLCWKSP
jgi:hypothetical protein